MSVALDITNAVRDKLNGGTFSQSFTAVSSLVPRFSVKDLANVQVQVIPNNLQAEAYDRGGVRCDYQIDVGVAKSGVETVEQADELLTLTEELQDFLSDEANRVIAKEGNDIAVYLAPFQSEPLLDRKRLDEDRTFFAVSSFTYRTIR